MAVLSLTANTTWASSSITGANTVNLQNISGRQVSYAVATTTPNSGWIGMILTGHEPHRVLIASGETLYIKVLNSGGANVDLRAIYA